MSIPREIQNTVATPAQEGKNWAFWNAGWLDADLLLLRDTGARTPPLTPPDASTQGNRALLLFGLGQEMTSTCNNVLNQQ